MLTIALDERADFLLSISPLSLQARLQDKSDHTTYHLIVLIQRKELIAIFLVRILTRFEIMWLIEHAVMAARLLTCNPCVEISG